MIEINEINLDNGISKNPFLNTLSTYLPMDSTLKFEQNVLK